MKYNKQTLAATALVGITGLGAISATAAAHDTPGGQEHPVIINKLAETFNLDEDKVNEVFRQEHQARHEERQQKLNDRLDQAVKDGKITEEQRTKLLTKMAEMRESHEEGRHERGADRRQHMEEVKQWAQDNGIDLESLELGHRPGSGGHRQR